MPTQLVMGVYVEYWILGLHYNLVTWLLSRLIYIVFVLEVKTVDLVNLFYYGFLRWLMVSYEHIFVFLYSFELFSKDLCHKMLQY